MPTNLPIECPYCDKKIVSYYLQTHIVSQHTEQLLNYNPLSQSDQRNIVRLNPEKYPKNLTQPFFFHMPKDTDSFHYCFGCKRGMKKQAMANLHYKKKSCLNDHAENLQEFWNNIKHILDGSAPSNPIRTDDTTQPSFDTTQLEKLLWNFVKQDYSYQAQLDIANRHLEAIERSGHLTEEEFNDLEPMGAEGCKIKKMPWTLYPKVPCEKDIAVWIKKFEKPEHQEMWLNRLK